MDPPQEIKIQSVVDPNKELLADHKEKDTQSTEQRKSIPTPPVLTPQVSQEKKGDIFREMAISRKGEGFNQWKRNEELMMSGARQHMLCMNTINDQLEQRITQSERALQTIAQFLKDRVLLEQNNAQLLSQKNPAFIQVFKHQSMEQNKVVQHVPYPKLTQSLESLNQLHQAQGKSLQTLILSLEKLIREKFEGNLSVYQKAINPSRDKIRSGKSRIKELNEQTIIRIQKVIKTHSEMMANGGKHKKRSKDLFNCERRFHEAALAQIQLQTQLGEELINLYNEVMKQETIRLEIITTGIKLYIEKFHETYSGTTPSAQVQMVIKQFQEYNPSSETSQSKILYEELVYIKEALKCTEIGYPQIKNYLTQYPASLIKPTLAQNHPLILKYFQKIQRDVGSLTTKWASIIIVVSIDNNLLIFDSDDTSIPNKKASYKFAIENTQLIQKSKTSPIIAELRYTISGMIYNSQKTVQLRFNSQDEYEELQFYLSQNKQK